MKRWFRLALPGALATLLTVPSWADEPALGSAAAGSGSRLGSELKEGEEASRGLTSTRQLEDFERQRLDLWLRSHDLNEYGDPRGTTYPNGNPLTDADGRTVDRYDYILERHPELRPYAGQRDVNAEQRLRIDRWLRVNRLNEYGDREGTVYAGGSPLFDAQTGRWTDRYDYLLSRNPSLAAYAGLDELDVTQRERVDAWLRANRLNEYGDPEGTTYANDNPLIDPRTGYHMDRYDYVLSRHPQLSGFVSIAEPSPELRAHIDRWIREGGYNEYGDAMGTVYAGGTPLFDEHTGQRVDRYQYILSRHPELAIGFEPDRSRGVALPGVTAPSETAPMGDGSPSASATQVMLNGQPVLEFRAAAGGYSAAERRDVFMRRLEEARGSGPLAPTAITVRRVGGLPVIHLNGHQLVTITAPDARAHHRSAMSLANEWARRLRQALSN
ncbi:MAG: hypothetical protein HUU35_03900 [Armatimonadetes bacterium]|nr:hypothetical protein [Armatimonadota bacterium]